VVLLPFHLQNCRTTRKSRITESPLQSPYRRNLQRSPLLVLAFDAGGCSSGGEEKLKRCLIPLETPGIEGNRIGPPIDRDLDILRKEYPRALGQLGIYARTNKKPWLSKPSRPNPSLRISGIERHQLRENFVWRPRCSVRPRPRCRRHVPG
jgi:hypothetical protein